MNMKILKFLLIKIAATSQLKDIHEDSDNTERENELVDWMSYEEEDTEWRRRYWIWEY